MTKFMGIETGPKYCKRKTGMAYVGPLSIQNKTFKKYFGYEKAIK